MGSEIRSEIFDTGDPKVKSARLEMNAPASTIFRLLSQPKRHLGRWVWRYELKEISPYRTLVTETFDGRPSPFQWWLNARKAYPFTQIAVAKTLVRLKKLVEAQ